MDNIFSGIELVKVNSESQKQYFLPGKFSVRIENVFLHKKRLGGHVFVVETTVLESNNPEIQTGEARNWVQPMEMDAAMPRVKCFIGAAKGYDPKRNLDDINKIVTQTLCESVVSGEITFKGVILDLECFNRRSNKTGKSFTIHLWSPAKGMSMIEN